MSARVAVGEAPIDLVTGEEAVARVIDHARSRCCCLVVTPNIQHVAELRTNPKFREAYRRACLVIPDGWPVALAARMLAKRQQARVTGADLVEAVCMRAEAEGLSVGFLGGRPGAAAAAASELHNRLPALEVAVVEPAPEGFLEDPRMLAQVLEHVADAAPAVLFVALGTPRAEIFGNMHKRELGAGVICCVGAAIDFEAGAMTRAPLVLQRAGLEWLHRIVKEPRRLTARYVRAAPLFLLEVLRTVAKRRVGARSRD